MPGLTPNSARFPFRRIIRLDFPEAETDVHAYWDKAFTSGIYLDLPHQELALTPAGAVEYVSLQLTEPGVTYVTGASFDAVRQDILDGFDGSPSFNTNIRDNTSHTAVVRTSDTEVHVQFTGNGSYTMSGDETVAITVPAGAVGAAEDLTCNTLAIEASHGLPSAGNAEPRIPGTCTGDLDGDVPSTMHPDANSAVTGPSCILHVRILLAGFSDVLDYANGTLHDSYGRTISASPVVFTSETFATSWSSSIPWTKSGGTAARHRWENGSPPEVILYLQLNKSGYQFDRYPGGSPATADYFYWEP